MGISKLKLIINGLWEIFLQLIYPRRCPVCDNIVTPFGEKICPRCITKLKIIEEPWCIKCGKALLQETALCRDCERQEHYFERGRSLYEYRSAALSIYRFKYGGRREYASLYASHIRRFLGPFIESVRPDMLIPIPLHRKRYRKRGYNQAEILAKEISSEMNIPVCKGAMRRIKNTSVMKMLAPSERRDNIKNAFIISRNSVKLKTIIIIDDIYTTGATIDEAARALKEAGAKKVYFVTLAGGSSL